MFFLLYFLIVTVEALSLNCGRMRSPGAAAVSTRWKPTQIYTVKASGLLPRSIKPQRLAAAAEGRGDGAAALFRCRKKRAGES